MDRPRPNRLGAFGFTAVLALLGTSTIAARHAGRGLCHGATAAATAPPPAPLPETVSQVATRLVNVARAAAGLSAVAEDPRLDASAAGHSADQAARQTMTHSGANGSTPGQRMQSAGFGWHTWGENVAAGQRTADEAVSAWLNSPRTGRTSSTRRSPASAPPRPSARTGGLYWTMDLAA